MRSTMSALRVTSFWRSASSTGLRARAWCPPSISTTSPILLPCHVEVDPPSGPGSQGLPGRRWQPGASAHPGEDELPSECAPSQMSRDDRCPAGARLLVRRTHFHAAASRSGESQVAAGARDTGPERRRGRSRRHRAARTAANSGLTLGMPAPTTGPIVRRRVARTPAAWPPPARHRHAHRRSSRFVKPGQAGRVQGTDAVEDRPGTGLPRRAPSGAVDRERTGADDDGVGAGSGPAPGSHLGAHVATAHTARAEVPAVRDPSVVSGQASRNGGSLGARHAAPGLLGHRATLARMAGGSLTPVELVRAMQERGLGRPLIAQAFSVGVAGFEPAAFRSQSGRATKLAIPRARGHRHPSTRSRKEFGSRERGPRLALPSGCELTRCAGVAQW